MASCHLQQPRASFRHRLEGYGGTRHLLCKLGQCCEPIASSISTLAANKIQQYTRMIRSEPEIGTNDAFPRDYLEPFLSIWNDSGAQTAIDRGNEYALHDNLK